MHPLSVAMSIVALDLRCGRWPLQHAVLDQIIVSQRHDLEDQLLVAVKRPPAMRRVRDRPIRFA
jgi:hypothetical protein